MYILIDDVRDIDKYVHGNCDKLVIRTFDQAINFISITDITNDTLLMDNDLGDLGEGREGYDILNFALTNDNKPKCVYIVSSNPVGRKRMSLALEANGYVYRAGRYVLC